MKLLLVAATEAEITPVLQHLSQNWTPANTFSFIKANKEINICITGVGILATAYALTKACQQPSDFALQAGIAGSFDRTIALSSLVNITSDQYGDLGAEDHYNFLDIFDLGLLQAGSYPFSGKELLVPVSSFTEKIDLPEVKGITVNTVAGSAFTIQSRIEKFGAQVESMEGAAFHYVCLQEKIPFAQVRSISNYTEPRDKSKWQMKEAVINLNKWLIDFIEKL